MTDLYSDDDGPALSETTAQNRILRTLRQLGSPRARVRVMTYVTDVMSEELEREKEQKETR